jgi:hypothetical protein
MSNLPKAERRALERKLHDVRKRSVAALEAMGRDAEKAAGKGLLQVWLYSCRRLRSSAGMREIEAFSCSE